MSKLGRGLGSLLSISEEAAAPLQAAENGVVTVDINLVRGNPNQPRKEFEPSALAELSDSIREKGIIQPILVEKEEDGGYQIVAGERRFRAAKLAGLTEVPVIVRSFTDEDRMEIALIENVQREDLSPMEEARAYRHLMESFNLSQEEVAKKVGKQRSTVANSLRLLKLPEDMQAALGTQGLTPGHARAILSVTNPADQRLLFGRILEQGLSVREAEAMANDLNAGNRPGTKQPTAIGNRPAGSKSADLEFLQQKFMDVLGTKVALKGNGKKGSLEITYFSEDDLARLYELFSKGEALY